MQKNDFWARRAFGHYKQNLLDCSGGASVKNAKRNTALKVQLMRFQGGARFSYEPA